MLLNKIPTNTYAEASDLQFVRGYTYNSCHFVTRSVTNCWYDLLRVMVHHQDIFTWREGSFYLLCLILEKDLRNRMKVGGRTLEIERQNSWHQA